MQLALIITGNNSYVLCQTTWFPNNLGTWPLKVIIIIANLSTLRYGLLASMSVTYCVTPNQLLLERSATYCVWPTKSTVLLCGPPRRLH